NPRRGLQQHDREDQGRDVAVDGHGRGGWRRVEVAAPYAASQPRALKLLLRCAAPPGARPASARSQSGACPRSVEAERPGIVGLPHGEGAFPYIGGVEDMDFAAPGLEIDGRADEPGLALACSARLRDEEMFLDHMVDAIIPGLRVAGLPVVQIERRGAG